MDETPTGFLLKDPDTLEVIAKTRGSIGGCILYHRYRSRAMFIGGGGCVQAVMKCDMKPGISESE